MSKTFEEYQAEYTKAPYAFPLPGGDSIAVPQPDLNGERAAVAAANAAPTLADGLMAGIRTYVGEDDAAKIAEAWCKLPSTAFQAAVNDMRDYFGTKNS